MSTEAWERERERERERVQTSGAMASTKVQRIMTQPIVRASSLLLFRLLSLSLFVLLLIFPFVFSRWYRRRIQNLIFRFLQSVSSLITRTIGFALVYCILSRALYVMQKARIQIWLFEQKDLRIEGRITVSRHRIFSCFSVNLSLTELHKH